MKIPQELCREAGMLALREGATVVARRHFNATQETVQPRRMAGYVCIHKWLAGPGSGIKMNPAPGEISCGDQDFHIRVVNIGNTRVVHFGPGDQPALIGGESCK